MILEPTHVTSNAFNCRKQPWNKTSVELMADKHSCNILTKSWRMQSMQAYTTNNNSYKKKKKIRRSLHHLSLACLKSSFNGYSELVFAQELANRELTITGGLCISKQHPCTRHVEHRVGHVGYLLSVIRSGQDERKKALTVSAGHAALHHNYFLALPGMQNRHAGDRRVGFQGDRVDGIVRTDYQGDIRVRKIIVDLVHFQYDFVQSATSPYCRKPRNVWQDLLS